MNTQIRPDRPVYPALEQELRSLEETDPDSWRINVLKTLIDTLDFDGYAALQKTYLNDPGTHKEGKFLDLPYWLFSKMDIVEQFGLHEAAPLRILDIGGGNGLFAIVLRALGHEVIITDTTVNPMYEALVAFHNIDRRKLIVEAMTPVGLDCGPFDLVTALMTVFNKRPHQWETAEWGYFFHDVATTLVKPDGRLLVKLSLKHHDDRFAGWLESLGAEVVRKGSFIDFKDVTKLRELETAPVGAH